MAEVKSLPGRRAAKARVRAAGLPAVETSGTGSGAAGHPRAEGLGRCLRTASRTGEPRPPAPAPLPHQPLSSAKLTAALRSGHCRRARAAEGRGGSRGATGLSCRFPPCPAKSAWGRLPQSPNSLRRATAGSVATACSPGRLCRDAVSRAAPGARRAPEPPSVPRSQRLPEDGGKGPEAAVQPARSPPCLRKELSLRHLWSALLL